MQRNEIIRSYGTDYKGMTKRLLKAADLKSEISSPALRIGIKPNLVTPTPASYGATTHPEIVAGIIEYLKENDIDDISIIEGSWVGDKTSEAFEYCGYNALSKKYGVKLIDTQKEASYAKNCGGLELNICNCVKDMDFLINVPVLKGHCQTHITCALKNLKGLIPNKEKRRFHSMNLHDPIAHLNIGIKQDFIVIDNICGDLDFEEGGNPVTCNCIMAAKDPVLTDAYVCRTLGYELGDVPYINIAASLGVGSNNLDSLKLITLEGKSAAQSLASGKVLEVSYAVDEIDSCSACYASLIPALARLKDEGLLETLNEKICIGQGYRGQKGRLGIGHCTAGFNFSIQGCPPGEEDVYNALKEYILTSSKA